MPRNTLARFRRTGLPLLALCAGLATSTSAEGPVGNDSAPPRPPSTSKGNGQRSASALDALEQRILGKGCAPKLLGDAKRRFIESQLLCDGHLSFILVQAALDGHPLPDTRRRLHALLGDALGRARAPFMRGGADFVLGHALPRSILYRGYVLLMLAGIERAGMQDAASTALFDALANQVVAALEHQLLLPSFSTSIWPCDSAPAAAALLLHARLRGHAPSEAAAERLIARLVELSALPSGFPTRVDAKGRAVERTQRATTLAWTGAFLAMAAHPAAESFTTTLVRDYCARPAGALLPLAACREWPRGVKRQEDSASGPLALGGYSVGASALAIAATRLSGTHVAWHAHLVNAAREMGINDILSRPGKRPLEAALYGWGTTIRPW
nr:MULTISPECIES: hypothetical protein [unclassified Myxococcus]